jgi:hypothetical protein
MLKLDRKQLGRRNLKSPDTFHHLFFQVPVVIGKQKIKASMIPLLEERRRTSLFPAFLDGFEKQTEKIFQKMGVEQTAQFNRKDRVEEVLQKQLLISIQRGKQLFQGDELLMLLGDHIIKKLHTVDPLAAKEVDENLQILLPPTRPI